MNKILRKIQNVLLIVLGLIAFRMVLWVQEQDYLLGYVLGIGLLAFTAFIIIERVSQGK